MVGECKCWPPWLIENEKLKNHWLKRSKAVPQKTKFGQKYKWFKISHLDFLFFWKYYFGQIVCIRPQVPVDIIKVFFNFSKFQDDFTIQFRSKNLTHFTSLNPFDIENNMPRNTNKTLSDFTNIPENMFLFGVRNNICTAPFLDAQEPHSWSTLKANVCICIFLYISVRKFLFQKRSKILTVEGRLNNFLKATHCSGLVKCFTIFYFNWKFWKSNFFSAFRYYHL